MDNQLGLSSEEMIQIFNHTYLSVWEQTREQVNWSMGKISEGLAAGEKVDIAPLLLELMEVVVTAARDGVIVTVQENNQKLMEDLKAAGIEVPASWGP